MADLTLRPDGDVQLTNIAITGNTASEAVDEPPDSNDGDTTRIDRDSLTADASATLRLSTTPSDFKQMDAVTARAAVRTSGLQVDDSLELFAQLVTAGGDALTNEIAVATSNAVGVTYEVAEAAFTGVVPAGKNDWDNAQVKLRWDHTATGSADSFDLRLTAFEVDGTYTPRDVGRSVKVFTRLPATRTRSGHSTTTVPAPTSDVGALTVAWHAATTHTVSSTAEIGRVVGTRHATVSTSRRGRSDASAQAIRHSASTSRRIGRDLSFRRVHTPASTTAVAAEDDDLLLLLQLLDH